MNLTVRVLRDASNVKFSPADARSGVMQRVLDRDGRNVAVEFRLAAWSDALTRSTGGMCGWHGGWLAWVGRVRNRRELALQLGLKSTVAVSQVLRHLVETFGSQAPSMLEGACALVVLDERAEHLTWSRDKFGSIPTTFGVTKRYLWISTLGREWKLNLNDDQMSDQINLGRISKYLARVNDRGADEFWRGSQRLRPAESLKVDLKDLFDWQRTRYWQPSYDAPPLSPHVFLDEFRSTFAQVLEGTISPDEHASISMSSGLDSTFIAAMLTRQSREHTWKAGTMSFPNFPSVDETAATMEVGSDLGVAVHPINMEDVPPMSNLAAYVEFPGLGPAFHPGEVYETAFLRRAARRLNSDVIFHGVGAEFLFHGALSSLLKAAVRRSKSSDSVSCLLRAIQLAKMASVSQRAIRQILRACVTEWLPDDVTSALRELLVYRRMDRRLELQLPALTSFTRAQVRSDLSLPQDSFDGWVWELVCRMAWRLQQRAGVWLERPYLDGRLLNLVARAPWELYFRTDRPSHRPFFGRLTAGVIPEKYRGASKRGGFDAFIRARSRAGEGAQLTQMFESSRLEEYGLLSPGALGRAWSNFEQPRSFEDPDGFRTTLGFWRAASLELWLREVC